MAFRFAFLCAFLCAFSLQHEAHAQHGQQPEAKKLRYSSGTGFFVSRNGYVVTNEHVVRGCKSITLAGAIEDEARLIATHPKQDLALLKTKSNRVPQVAPIRINLRSLRLGDTLNVVGFPGRSGFDGNLVYAKTVLLSMDGPMGEPNFLEFHNSAQKGNSGGPLLDDAGNVIGVVTGKAQVIQRGTGANAGQVRVVKESDIAITIPYLRPFLSRHGVHFNVTGGGLTQSAKQVAKKARKSIVHVRCLQGEVPAQ